MEKQTRQLLIRFLNNQCTVDEERQVNRLLDKPEVMGLLYQLMHERDIAAEQEASIPDDNLLPNMEKWQQRINQRISASMANTKDSTGRIRSMGRAPWLRYAAVFAGFLLVAAIAVWQLDKSRYGPEQMVTVENTGPQGTPAMYVLPDSTQVYLGVGSRLQYPENFDGDIRETILQGEAFFSVTRDAAKPFIVRTGEISTTVLGTTFRVRTTADRSVTVAVATGKVGVSHRAGKGASQLALLTPGRKVTWDAGTRQATEGTVDTYALEQWAAGDLYFDEETLEEIAGELQRRYGVTVSFGDGALRTKRVSGSFAAGKAVDKVIHTLSVAGKFRYETSDGNRKFIIYKKD